MFLNISISAGVSLEVWITLPLLLLFYVDVFVLSIINNQYVSLGLASLFPPLCSHVQSIQYYKVSINPKECEFVGVSSSNERAVMGMDYEDYHQNDGERRKYYLTTTNKCPYYGNSRIILLYSVNIFP